jgi:hypothetical protein
VFKTADHKLLLSFLIMAIRSWTDKELLQIYPVRTSRWFNSCVLANYLTFTVPTIVKVLTASDEAA